jgi:hypothetical protein
MLFVSTGFNAPGFNAPASPPHSLRGHPQAHPRSNPGSPSKKKEKLGHAPLQNTAPTPLTSRTPWSPRRTPETLSVDDGDSQKPEERCVSGGRKKKKVFNPHPSGPPMCKDRSRSFQKARRRRGGACAASRWRWCRPWIGFVDPRSCSASCLQVPTTVHVI